MWGNVSRYAEIAFFGRALQTQRVAMLWEAGGNRPETRDGSIDGWRSVIAADVMIRLLGARRTGMCNSTPEPAKDRFVVQRMACAGAFAMI